MNKLKKWYAMHAYEVKTVAAVTATSTVLIGAYVLGLKLGNNCYTKGWCKGTEDQVDHDNELMNMWVKQGLVHLTDANGNALSHEEFINYVYGDK